VAHGHGPLANIFDNYTLEHVNHFLREVALDDRRRFKETIIATRVAGATDKGYRDYMNHLRGQERVVKAQQRGRRQVMTYEERLKLESQRHVKFNQMSAQEQARLEQERAGMWKQIPQHLQAKAGKMAGR